MWVPVNDALADQMIGVLLQPSLSSTNHHQATGSRTSAFVLKTLSQSGIMVGFINHAFARVEGTRSLRARGDCQVAHAHIDTSHTRVGFWSWVRGLDLERHQQVKLLFGRVVPQLGSANFSALLDESNMLVIACIGHHHTARKRQNAHMLLCLETVVFAVLIS